MLRHCSSCVASEENENCLERPEIGCPHPPTLAHTTDGSLESWSSIQKLKTLADKPHADSLQPAPRGHTMAAQPRVTLPLGGSGYMGQTLHYSAQLS